ncbi:hypothetical protein QN326_03060 [Candidatus Phytoplasma asteris]|uniref:Uncharacterized protein n=1 Tax=Candidatus Phytoplasma asteris TaxID=85620 RepID=A0ABZ3CEV5_9MOLU
MHSKNLKRKKDKSKKFQKQMPKKRKKQMQKKQITKTFPNNKPLKNKFLKK